MDSLSIHGSIVDECFFVSILITKYRIGRHIYGFESYVYCSCRLNESLAIMCPKKLSTSYLRFFFTLNVYIQMWICSIYIEYLSIGIEYFPWTRVLNSTQCTRSVSRFVQKIIWNVEMHGEGEEIELCVTHYWVLWTVNGMNLTCRYKW